MKNKTLTTFFSLLLSLVVFGQEKKELDKKAIKDLCGCYEITFKYTETFAPERDYEKKADYTASALELALPIVDEENKISIQHLLLVNDTTVIKHWRQDWLYENDWVFYYDKNNNWTFKKLGAETVQGQWTQKVYQTDDSPRYSGSATWVHLDGKHYWESKTDAPLPRREYSKRDDYNVMKRGNRHEITDYGWVHEQDNDKIVREQGKDDMLVAQEKGMNIYKRVPDENCQLAKEWWQEHSEFWAGVRASWDEVYRREGDLTLAKKVDDKPLYKYFHTLEKEGAKKEQISEVISKFVLSNDSMNNAEGK